VNLPAFHQAAFVVSDLDAAVRQWSDDLGIGPWSVWTLQAPILTNMTYHGRDADFAIRHALAWSGGLQFELVQPLYGPSIFQDQLSIGDRGFNHIGVVVPDLAAAIAEQTSRGFVALQSASGFGQTKDGAFCYMQSPNIDTIVELISPPTTRFEPEYRYPDDAA
jgi:methylmalonyl-CoA/ethylmalonyl-CoA epimerase